MARLRTPGFAHHSLKFAPFFDGVMAVASSANFGLVGNGRVHIVRMVPGALAIEKT